MFSLANPQDQQMSILVIYLKQRDWIIGTTMAGHKIGKLSGSVLRDYQKTKAYLAFRDR